MERLNIADSNRVITAIGGVSVVARALGVTKGAVSQWKRLGIPDYRVLVLQKMYRTLPEVRDTLSFKPWQK